MSYNPIVSQRACIFVSSSSGNKFPQTWWLRVTHIYFFILLESRHPKSISLGWNKGIVRTMLFLKALRENLLLISSSFSWLLASPGLWPHHSISVSMLHCLFLLSTCQSSLCLSLRRTYMHLVLIQIIQDNLLSSWSLTNICNLGFWPQVTCTGSKDGYVDILLGTIFSLSHSPRCFLL